MIDNLRMWFADPGDYYSEAQLPVGMGGMISGQGWGANWGAQDPQYNVTPQQSGYGNQGFFIPKGGTGQQPVASGYSPTGQGIQNYMQGQGSMQQIPNQYQPQGLPQQMPGSYDPNQYNYLAQGGLRQQGYNLSQSGIAQGIQNMTSLAQSQGIPTGMAGARTVADIAAGSASADQKQRTQDALSALQGQRGTGAGLGSNVDTMMGQALGIDASAARSTYANALVSYLQNQLQQLTAGSRSLAPQA